MSSKHAVVVSYLALFVALGGTAAALQGKRSVKSDDLASGAVTTRALAKKAVSTGKLKAGAVDTRQLARTSVGLTKLKDQSVESRTIVNGTIGSPDIGRLSELDFGIGTIANRSLVGTTQALRISALRVAIAGNQTIVTPPAYFDFSTSGAGGLVLDGSAGQQSGYLRFVEGAGSPPDFSNTATLVARDNGAGKVQLVVFWPGGTSEVLATQP